MPLSNVTLVDDYSPPPIMMITTLETTTKVIRPITRLDSGGTTSWLDVFRDRIFDSVFLEVGESHVQVNYADDDFVIFQFLPCG